MRRFTSPLEGVRVASPCPADWDKMAGDDRVRYCNQCELHVYNLSGMTRREAESLVSNAEGWLCIRYYRRADGSILTRNCPVGLRALKQRVSRTAAAALSAVVGLFAGLGINLGFGSSRSNMTPPYERTMGEMAVTPTRVEPPSPPAAAPVTLELKGEYEPVAGRLEYIPLRPKQGKGGRRRR